MPELPEDVLIQKDTKRAFPVSFRFPLWEQQSGKCALTGIEIPQSDIFNGQKYVIDPSISIEQYLIQVSKEINSQINIQEFLRFEIGS